MLITIALLFAVVSTEGLAKGGKSGKKARELALDVKGEIEARIAPVLKEERAPTPAAQERAPSEAAKADDPPEKTWVAAVFKEVRAAITDGDPPAMAPDSDRPVKIPGKAGVAVAWLVVGGGALMFLLISLLFARAARRPPRARGGSVGRAKAAAHKIAPPGPAEALAALEAAKLGKLVASTADAEVARVSIHPRRRGACREIEAFLTGAFESAWGRDVAVEHLQCSKEKKGVACDYVVRPVLSGLPVSSSGPRGAGAYSPGWSFEPDRSPPARPDVPTAVGSVPRTGSP